ncbi:MAG TPA: GxxExxY protein [Phycisphaerae bacterium]|nr:GxxExxY protein [Phycisphaerae bacterium]
MNADERRLQLDKITETIIGCAFKVHNTLGCGFLEKVYENALAYELRKAGLFVEQQVPIDVFYEEQCVGQYCADLRVERSVIVELKTARAFDDAHIAQSINYLAATSLTVCLLMNFAKPRLDFKRIVRNF